MRVFYKYVSSATHMYYDTASHQIIYATSMYDAKELRQVVREVTIDEGEWRALKKYGEDAGFNDE